MNELRWVGLLLGLGLLQVFLPVVWSPLEDVDWLLILVAHQALRSSFRRSVILGAAAGLVQDGLSGEIVGLHGFSKTTVAALVAAFGSFLVIRGPFPEAVVSGLASALESTILIVWLALLGRSASTGTVNPPARAVATALATALVLISARWLSRRRARRRTFE